jgi:hypothetical protein
MGRVREPAAGRQGLGNHLRQHAYEYRRKFDVELALIRRLKARRRCPRASTPGYPP